MNQTLTHTRKLFEDIDPRYYLHIRLFYDF